MKLEPCGREACAQIIEALKRKWTTLTEDEIWSLAQDYGDLSWQNCTLDFVRAIEAKLREKNGY